MKKKKNKSWLLNRREFVKGSAAVSALTLLGPGCIFQPNSEEDLFVPQELRKVSDFTSNLYHSELDVTMGTSTGYSPHCVNCKGNCAWNTFEQGGRVVREEQVAGYPQIAPGIPDANPRGCNKGALHSQSLYEKDRILFPMKRVGARGEGKWEKVSWDEALLEVAEKIVEMGGKEEFDKMMIYAGTGILSPVRRSASLRLGSLLGAVRFNVASAVGDMFPGATTTYGISTVGCSSEAWYEADYVFTWGINPSVTRMPDSHYLWEGKYKGTRVVSISPDYNPTARQSSLWIPIKPGTDSFLAMSMVHVIIKEKLFDESFMREQTDLPLLVKLENGKLLRESDLMKGGGENTFYFYDIEKKKPVKVRGSIGDDEPTLDLNGVKPALEGMFTITSSHGDEIKVTTVFEMVKKETELFSPEHTRKFTGIHPNIVRGEAKKFASAKVAIIMQGYRMHKYFWGALAMRGAALMLALTGHGGRRGGLDIDNEWGIGDLSPLSAPKPARFGSGFLGEWMDGDMQKSFLSHYDDGELKKKAGLGKNELLQRIDSAINEEGFSYFGKPKLMVLFHDNKFSRNSAQKQTEKAVLDSLDLYVNINYRLDSSASLADIILPSVTNYESYEIRMDPGYGRFANLMIPPEGLKLPGDVKSEWEICMLLCKKIEEVAKRNGIDKVDDPKYMTTRDFGSMYKDFITVDGQEIKNYKEVLEWVMDKTLALGGADIKKAAETGFISLGRAAGQVSPLYPDRPFYPFEFQTQLKRPYFTNSGRQQFYVDQEFYLKMGFAVPSAREPVRPDKYPFAFYNPHTRYGIHTTWRMNKYHLRLQRSGPVVCISPLTAKGKRYKTETGCGYSMMLGKRLRMRSCIRELQQARFGWSTHGRACNQKEGRDTIMLSPAQ